MIKVLHVTSSYYPATSFGGSVTADYDVDRCIMENYQDKCSISVYTTTAGIDSQNKRRCVDFEGVINVKFFSFIGPSSLSFSLAYLKALYLNVRKYDIVHFSGIWNIPTLIGPLICRNFGIPYIITPHGTLYKETFLKKKRFIKNVLYQLFVKKNITAANGVHFTTDNEFFECKDFLGLNIARDIIPYGISEIPKQHNIDELSAFLDKWQLSRTRFRILFLGRINWKKGLDVLIDSLNILKSRNVEVQLVCVGKNEGYLSELKEKLNDKSMLVEIGHLDGSEKELAYQSSDVFVLPSYSENFGMTVIEAAANKVPIIMSNKVGLHKVFSSSSAAIVIEPDPHYLADAIISLTKKGESYTSQLKTNAFDLTKEVFSTKSVSRKFITMYEKCSKKG